MKKLFLYIFSYYIPKNVILPLQATANWYSSTLRTEESLISPIICSGENVTSLRRITINLR